MAIGLVISSPHYSETEEEYENEMRLLKTEINAYEQGSVVCNFYSTEHGLGASWETITLQILSIATTAFFGIPALRKKLKEAIEGWKDIKKDFDAFANWFSNRHEIYSYSKEAAFLRALEHLETEHKVNVDEASLLGILEVPGASSALEGDFFNTELLYYQFVFEANRQIFFLLYDSKLSLVSQSVTPYYPEQYRLEQYVETEPNQALLLKQDANKGLL